MVLKDMIGNKSEKLFDFQQKSEQIPEKY